MITPFPYLKIENPDDIFGIGQAERFKKIKELEASAKEVADLYNEAITHRDYIAGVSGAYLKIDCAGIFDGFSNYQIECKEGLREILILGIESKIESYKKEMALLKKELEKLIILFRTDNLLLKE